mmetsp:Transcript_88474/g.143270  ORF Transcript_88474/g.143270 Transcript_88474/m.143270 type:complete len:259 (-) Transcript_88474:285-1061(-)
MLMDRAGISNAFSDDPSSAPAGPGSGIISASDFLILNRIIVIGEPGFTPEISMYSAGIPSIFASLLRCDFAKTILSSSDANEASNFISITSDASSASSSFWLKAAMLCVSGRMYSSKAHSEFFTIFSRLGSRFSPSNAFALAPKVFTTSSACPTSAFSTCVELAVSIWPWKLPLTRSSYCRNLFSLSSLGISSPPASTLVPFCSSYRHKTSGNPSSSLMRIASSSAPPSALLTMGVQITSTLTSLCLSALPFTLRSGN